MYARKNGTWWKNDGWWNEMKRKKKGNMVEKLLWNEVTMEGIRIKKDTQSADN